MAGTAHTAYLPTIEGYLKGATKSDNDTFMQANILRVLRDFCKHTWIWRETLDKISVLDTVSQYTMTPGVTNCDVPDVHYVDWVKYKEDGNDDDQFVFLNPVNLESEEVVGGGTHFSAGYVNSESPSPREFHVDPADKLNIYPIPNDVAAGTDNMQVKCILKPALTATTSPTFIYSEHEECIAYGVAARIMEMSGKKWYNAQLAEYYGTKYKKLRDTEAKVQRWEGKNRKRSKIVFNNGMAGGSRRQGSVY